MSRHSEYISLHDVIAEYMILFGEPNNTQKEEFAVIFGDNAVDEIMTRGTYKIYLAHHTLYQGKVKLNSNFMYPIQVFYRTKTDNNKYEKVTVSEWIKRGYDDEECTIKYNIKCHDCKGKDTCTCSKPVELDVTEMMLASNPELAIEYNRFLMGYYKTDKFFNAGIYDDFVIINPTQSYFFSLPNKIKNCRVPVVDEYVEYQIDNKVFEVNNTIDAEIIISYIGRRIDDNGLQLVPNEPYIIQAIHARIAQGFAYRDYMIRPSNATRAKWNDLMLYANRLISNAKSKHRRLTPEQWDSLIDNILMKRPIDNMDYRSGLKTPSRYTPPTLGTL